MKNKYESLDAVMEMLEDEYLEEALKEEEEKCHRLPVWQYAAAACICLAAAGSWWFLLNYNSHSGNEAQVYEVRRDENSENKKDTALEEKKNEIPEIKYEKSGESAAALEKIECDFYSEGGGGGGNHGWLIIKSLEDVTSKNPTRNNVEGITELPVFKNEKGLWKDFEKTGELGKEDVYFENLCYEETRDYSYDGSSSQRWQLCFQADKTKNITDQLLEYTFYRIYGCIYGKKDEETAWDWRRMMTPPSDIGKMYPLLSLEEAEQKLRRGEFFSHSAYDVDVAGTAQILSVELEYMTEEYHAYIQPFYKFLITDESWDLSSVMNGANLRCKDWKDYMSVSAVYVPAIQDEYLEIKDSAKLYTN